MIRAILSGIIIVIALYIVAYASIDYIYRQCGMAGLYSPKICMYQIISSRGHRRMRIGKGIFRPTPNKECS